MSGSEGAGRLAEALRPLFVDVGEYSRVVLPGQRLRGYQVGPAREIAASVTGGLGRQFAVVFSRQAGKEEMLAQLLTRYQAAGGGDVVAGPTLAQANVSRDQVLGRPGGGPRPADTNGEDRQALT